MDKSKVARFLAHSVDVVTYRWWDGRRTAGDGQVNSQDSVDSQ